MTAAQARAAVTSAAERWKKEVAEFQRALSKAPSKEKELRRRWREERGLIYTREYLVRAHFKRRPGGPIRKSEPQPKPAPLAEVRESKRGSTVEF